MISIGSSIMPPNNPLVGHSAFAKVLHRDIRVIPRLDIDDRFIAHGVPMIIHGKDGLRHRSVARFEVAIFRDDILKSERLPSG